jgi:prephenate dehydrogenase
MNLAANSASTRIALVGYGEVGRILAEDLRAQGLAVCAFDVKLAGPQAAALQNHALHHGVVLAASAAAAVQGASLVISAVTASQTLAVAQACAPALAPGALFLDFNSASPAPKPPPPLLCMHHTPVMSKAR